MWRSRISFIPKALGVALVLSLAACAHVPRTVADKTVSADELTLGNAIAAVTVNPGSDEMAWGAPNGYLVLIDESGGTRYFALDDAETPQLDWDEHGLFFADSKRDYRLGDALLVSDASRTNMQDAIIATGDGGSVGVYNHGIVGEDEYESQVSIFNGKKSDVYAVEGAYDAVAFCDGELFGIAEPSGSHLTALKGTDAKLGIGEFGLETWMLNKLAPTASHSEEFIAIVETVEAGLDDTFPPCVDRVMYELTISYTATGEEVPTLFAFNVDSGRVTDQALVDEGGKPVEVDPEYGLDAVSDESAVHDGRIEWVSYTGKYMSTEIGSGVTKELFRLAGYEGGNNLLEISPDEITAIVWQSDVATLVKYDRETGDQTFSVPVPGLDELMGGAFSYFPWDLAVRPSD